MPASESAVGVGNLSEYQFYEFLAVDRPLDERQQAELRALSTRADITATSLVNEYHFGSFRGDPQKLMEKYFDAFLYFANWGTHQLMIRLPEQLLDLDTAQRYCAGYPAHSWRHNGNVLIDLCAADENGEWEWDGTGETRLGSLIPIRADLAAGDHRALHIAWLLAAQSELDDEVIEPPVPPGLAVLTGPLHALVDFLRIDRDLLAVAARASGLRASSLAAGELTEWVTGLSGPDKDALLVRLINGDPHLRGELLQRIRRQYACPSESGRRTVGELLTAAAAHRAEREQEDRRRAAADRARKEREAAIVRQERFKTLAGREEQAWVEVSSLIDSKKPANYDAAVALLTDLRTIGEQAANTDRFHERYEQIRSVHRGKPSLMQRLDRAGL